MQLIKPMPFTEAVNKLGQQSPIGAALSSSEWSDLPVELRENAFFSANVESVRFLQTAKDSINDFLSSNTRPLPDGETVLATGSRAAFVDQMQRFLSAAGHHRGDGGLRDITSERRLGLIFDIKTQQAGDYGYWRQGMDPDVLNEFPASRFIRVKAVKEPRQLHNLYENQVYLKTDPIWALQINRDFHVPWGPWGWGCGHDVEDVDRDETEALGLIKPGQKLKPVTKHLNQNLQASIAGIEQDLLAKLKAVFGDRLLIEGDKARWNPTGKPTPAAPVATTPPAGPTAPVSAALDVRVRGGLKDEVTEALKAIDEVHDDGALPMIPVKSTQTRYFGFLTSLDTPQGVIPNHMAIRATGEWPALTTVHETGHFLDIAAIGDKGKYATQSKFPAMQAVLDAAEQSDSLKNLRAIRAAARDFDLVEHLDYVLLDKEIWARAYAQYIAERSSSELLKVQLQNALAYRDPFKLAQFRQWRTEDFAPIAEKIDAMFQQLGWL
jgi:hypothetical protein